MRTVYSRVPARDVINLASPRCPPEVVMHWVGKRGWHDPVYEPLRDLIEATYVRWLNKVGHYSRLEEDVLTRGFRNPVMLVTGKLLWRDERELPPAARRDRGALVCERLGGSRLYIAQKHGMVIPAVINDYGDACTVPAWKCRLCDGPKWPKAYEIKSEADLLARFKDRPEQVHFAPGEAAQCSRMPYSHMPRGYTRRQQSMLRLEAIRNVRTVVRQWLAENDR